MLALFRSGLSVHGPTIRHKDWEQPSGSRTQRPNFARTASTFGLGSGVGESRIPAASGGEGHPGGSTAPFWPLNEIVRGESPRAMNSQHDSSYDSTPQNGIVATAGAAVTSSKATSSAAASPTSF